MAKSKSKSAQSSKIITENFFSVVKQLSQAILRDNPTHGYRQTEDSETAAVMFVDHYKLNRADYTRILKIRSEWNFSLERRYGVKLLFGPAALAQNCDQLLRKHEVPQMTQIVTGLIDTIVAMLAIRTGAVSVRTVGGMTVSILHTV